MISMVLVTVFEAPPQKINFKLRASNTVRISFRKITIIMKAPKVTMPWTTQLVTIKPMETAIC